ncbi:hypothetical protein KOW79_018263 [Hemibagrus wyckioides]|uniref:RZZ complex subunit KNTC1/ROD C-terminal domain-containing protein n=1 Tax=Hemibagrus wyckioides TaxID=337641 RepID=A0A9D3NC03_9TELE|nr:hypothetical protein KOW79_018263 [Hemibagrus wyckioides]
MKVNLDKLYILSAHRLTVPAETQTLLRSGLCADIHAVANEIASISGVDLLKIRNILLEKWLCKTGQTNGKDIQYQDSVTDLTEDPDLMRVVYLLQMHPMDIGSCLLSPILSAETW